MQLRLAHRRVILSFAYLLCFALCPSAQQSPADIPAGEALRRWCAGYSSRGATALFWCVRRTAGSVGCFRSCSRLVTSSEYR